MQVKYQFILHVVFFTRLMLSQMTLMTNQKEGQSATGIAVCLQHIGFRLITVTSLIQYKDACFMITQTGEYHNK